MVAQKLSQPDAKAPVRVRVLREPRTRARLRSHDGISEECGRRQHDREEGILEVRVRRVPRRHASGVHEVGHRTHHPNACALGNIA